MTKKTKVLIVDDDKILLEMYKERLELSDFVIETAPNGERGLAKVHQEKPDIILLDIMMPKLDGFGFLEAVKSDPKTKDIPVIVFSALMTNPYQSKALSAGASGYLVKSEVMPGEIVKSIERILKKHHKTV